MATFLYVESLTNSHGNVATWQRDLRGKIENDKSHDMP